MIPRLRPSWLLPVLLPVMPLALLAAGPRGGDPPSSSAVLAQLPEGERKRQFIIDCTNCHQMSAAVTYPDGRVRTAAEWDSIVRRMLGYAGATTGFPVISAGRRADSTAAWLARHLTAPPRAAAAHEGRVGRAEVREFLLPQAQDLAHDVAVDSSGRVVVTGMFSHVMLTLDTATGAFTTVPIPVQAANPRAVEVDAQGTWWVLLGARHALARHDPSSGSWTVTPIGMYAHSIALDRAGRGWYNGHFTRDPERIGWLDPRTGDTTTVALPRHPTMAAEPGGPIPYELRAAPDGRIWMSELQGNRLLAYDPATGDARVYDMPHPVSAPRRFDVGPDGILWIPTYAANTLERFDPRTERFTSIPLPRADAAPYVARVDRAGHVWVGTNASDEVYRYDPRAQSWTTYPLPTPGAVIRHLVIDPRNGDVWLAYGGSPGIPARIARLRVGE